MISYKHGLQDLVLDQSASRPETCAAYTECDRVSWCKHRLEYLTCNESHVNTTHGCPSSRHLAVNAAQCCAKAYVARQQMARIVLMMMQGRVVSPRNLHAQSLTQTSPPCHMISRLVVQWQTRSHTKPTLLVRCPIQLQQAPKALVSTERLSCTQTPGTTATTCRYIARSVTRSVCKSCHCCCSQQTACKHAMENS